MKTGMKKDIRNLKEEDIYNLILYAIFKFSGDPEYSAISELIYSVDKDSLLNLCSIFGGCTIKIPTILELKIFIYALLVYYTSKRDNLSFDESLQSLGIDSALRKNILDVYKTVVEVINEYTS